MLVVTLAQGAPGLWQVQGAEAGVEGDSCVSQARSWRWVLGVQPRHRDAGHGMIEDMVC